ncbi:hypothetical protein EVJ58_g1801 [Rhodofomes roseus]|uniref:Protein kinase domain-containing protein n=1 Tax=Rhodofomes roseus TaxID=34475 RepID=A0A4Y9YZY1_9APHY|nr:hypothetical protein EVJ58_g1801 [Rhodofomes roseus]
MTASGTGRENGTMDETVNGNENRNARGTTSHRAPSLLAASLHAGRRLAGGSPPLRAHAHALRHAPDPPPPRGHPHRRLQGSKHIVCLRGEKPTLRTPLPDTTATEVAALVHAAEAAVGAEAGVGKGGSWPGTTTTTGETGGTMDMTAMTTHGKSRATALRRLDYQPTTTEATRKDATFPSTHTAVKFTLHAVNKGLTPLHVLSPPPLEVAARTDVVRKPRSPEPKVEEGQVEEKKPIPPPPVQHRTKRKPVVRSREEEAAVYGRIFVGCGRQDDYNVLTKLGEGTFGEVHKAVHREKGNCVALKRILMHNEKEGMPVTALREIKILKSLHHQNIIDIQDMFLVKSNGKEPLSVYMVFPYMDHDLAGLLENERVKFTPSQIKLYMKQLIEGTEYMHRNHILHRDMKAANLLISNDGCLKIADFGLARAFDPRITQVKEDVRGKERKYTNCVVTRWYRPPELLLGVRQYGGEVDMWGIGTVYEQLGPETIDLMDKLLTCNPRERLTAEQALDHDYFWTDPLPADPKSLPKYEASHEFDKRGRREGAGAPGGMVPYMGAFNNPRPLPPPMAQGPPQPMHRRPPPTRDQFRFGPTNHGLPPPTTHGLPQPPFTHAQVFGPPQRSYAPQPHHASPHRSPPGPTAPGHWSVAACWPNLKHEHAAVPTSIVYGPEARPSQSNATRLRRGRPTELWLSLALTSQSARPGHACKSRHHLHSFLINLISYLASRSVTVA